MKMRGVTVSAVVNGDELMRIRQRTTTPFCDAEIPPAAGEARVNWRIVQLPVVPSAVPHVAWVGGAERLLPIVIEASAEPAAIKSAVAASDRAKAARTCDSARWTVPRCVSCPIYLFEVVKGHRSGKCSSRARMRRCAFTTARLRSRSPPPATASAVNPQMPQPASIGLRGRVGRRAPVQALTRKASSRFRCSRGRRRTPR